MPIISNWTNSKFLPLHMTQAFLDIWFSVIAPQIHLAGKVTVTFVKMVKSHLWILILKTMFHGKIGCFVEVGQCIKKFQWDLRTSCDGELTAIMKNQWLSTLTHINNKHIQSSQFQTDLVNPNACVLRIDFPISYSCEYQDKVHSAWWSRESVILFTAAITLKSRCQTYLVSVAKTKERAKWQYLLIF